MNSGKILQIYSWSFKKDQKCKRFTSIFKPSRLYLCFSAIVFLFYKFLFSYSLSKEFDLALKRYKADLNFLWIISFLMFGNKSSVFPRWKYLISFCSHTGAFSISRVEDWCIMRQDHFYTAVFVICLTIIPRKVRRQSIHSTLKSVCCSLTSVRESDMIHIW